MGKEQNLGLSPIIQIPKREGINQHCSYKTADSICLCYPDLFGGERFWSLFHSFLFVEGHSDDRVQN